MAEQNSPVQGLSVTEVALREGNRTHYMVGLARGQGASPWDLYQVYTSDIPGRAAYTAADLRHFLGQAPKPDILKFDTDPPACLPAMAYREECEELRWKVLRLEEALANTHSALKELMIVAKVNVAPNVGAAAMARAEAVNAWHRSNGQEVKHG